MIFLWIIAAIAVILVILLLFACVCLYAAFGSRCDGNPSLKYFTSDDFDGLDCVKVEFPSNKGQLLRGAVYTHNTVDKPIGLVVFAHGMGGGHLSYTTQINTFAKAGFAVLAYDNTGTMASEGKSLGSFYQAVRDLRSALEFVRKNENLSSYRVVLAGHSWGGYAVCQALAYEESNVAGAVAFSAPDSMPAVICDTASSMLGFPMGWMRPFFTAASIITSGWQSRRSSASVLADTNKVPVMLLHGDADTTVRLSNSPISCKDVREKANITRLVYKDRVHNVFQTSESEEYLEEVFGAVTAAQKKYGRKGIPDDISKKLYDIDYELITREDPEVMKTVTDFMTDCVK